MVVSGNGMAPYAEDGWSNVVIGDQRFRVSDRWDCETSHTLATVILGCIYSIMCCMIYTVYV